MLPLASADIPDIVIWGGTLTLEDVSQEVSSARGVSFSL